MKIWIKRGVFLLLGILTLLIIFNYDLIGYGIGQGRGQFSILWQAKSIEETLADENFPDSLKKNLRLVEEIKQFAIDSLDLKPTKNYTTVYDQQGKEILWVVSACEPFAFEPRTWSFPIIGSFTYKGFFDFEKAKKLAEGLKDEGLDIHVRSVSGWSTLGWFRDPILSNMLAEPPGELANTIIHELTHATIFVPDSMTFNENLATFIGNRGAEKFLEFKYGPDSEQYQNYMSNRQDSKKFTRYIVKSANDLDSLYNTMVTYPDSVKQLRKDAFIEQLADGLQDVDFINKERYSGIYKRFKPNNAYFISFLNYRERQGEFDEMYYEEHAENLSSFIQYWKGLYSN